MERKYHLIRYTLMPSGGHFAAHEEPGLLADDITAFFGQVTATTGRSSAPSGLG